MTPGGGSYCTALLIVQALGPVPTSLEGGGEGMVRCEGGEPRSVAGC